jgi:hypothetical protein
MCLTAPGGEPPDTSGVIAIGRPLVGGTAAVFFINNGDNATTVTCGDACFAQVGLPAGAEVVVRDLWDHTDVSTVTGTFNATVAGGGASAFFKLTPA